MTADELKNLEAILHSPSYRLAEQDTDFLKLAALRPVRLQLELLKPEMTLEAEQSPLDDRRVRQHADH